MNLQIIKSSPAAWDQLNAILTSHISNPESRLRMETLIDRHTLDCQEMVVELANMLRDALFKPGLWPALNEFYRVARKSPKNVEGLDLVNLEYQAPISLEDVELVELDDSVQDVLRRNIFDSKDVGMISVFFEVEPLNVEGLSRMCGLLQASGKASERLLPDLLAVIVPAEEGGGPVQKTIDFPVSPEEDDEDDDEDEEEEH